MGARTMGDTAFRLRERKKKKNKNKGMACFIFCFGSEDLEHRKTHLTKMPFIGMLGSAFR